MAAKNVKTWFNRSAAGKLVSEKVHPGPETILGSGNPPEFYIAS